MMLYTDDQIFIRLEASFPGINLRIASSCAAYQDAQVMQDAAFDRIMGLKPADRLRVELEEEE